MAYLYLAIALLAGATKGYCGKRTSGRISGWRDAIMANFIRMLLCILLGLGFVAMGGHWQKLLPSGKELGIYALSGVATSVFVVSWLVAVRGSAFVLMDVFATMGLIIPMTLGNLCYGESLGWNHWVGFAILMCATLILGSYNNSIKKKIDGKAFAILLLSGVANGFLNFSQKMFQKEVADGAVAVFNFYTYVFSALSLGIFMLVSGNKEKTGRSDAVKRIFGYVLVMALSLFLNSYFMTMAAAGIPSPVLYPMQKGAGIILAGVMATCFFKEKLTPKAILGMSLSFIGLLVINLL